METLRSALDGLTRMAALTCATVCDTAMLWPILGAYLEGGSSTVHLNRFVQFSFRAVKLKISSNFPGWHMDDVMKRVSVVLWVKSAEKLIFRTCLNSICTVGTFLRPLHYAITMWSFIIVRTQSMLAEARTLPPSWLGMMPRGLSSVSCYLVCFSVSRKE